MKIVSLRNSYDTPGVEEKVFAPDTDLPSCHGTPASLIPEYFDRANPAGRRLESNGIALEPLAENGTTSGAGLGKLVPIALNRLSSKPTVSVLITCFNYGAYVGRAITSALQQTYAPAEIIVSDDGSQDNSCEVVESYIKRGLSIRLLRNTHAGMAANLNAAYRSCSGDVICLLDADDTFLPGKIEAVVRAFQAHPRAGFAIHRASLVDSHGRARGIYPLLRDLPSGNCTQAIYNNSGILMGLPPTTNLALRREVADRIFPIPVEYVGYAEQMIHRLAPLMTELCAISMPLAHWRLHGQNDQNSIHITPRRLERELKIMDSLWREQKHYLETVDESLARSFPPINRNPLYLKMNYIRHRMNNDPAMRQAYNDLCRYGLRENSTIDRFWQYSIRLPRPLFQRAVDLLETQSVWKQMITLAVRGKHTA
jgi:glycosyltransferase involved in cell wall biosynthesis